MARSFANVTANLLKTAGGKSDSRRKLIGAVRAASAKLGLADDDRKAIQLEETGKASMADMNPNEIGKVLDRLNRDQKGRGLGGSAERPHIGKIRALWWTLYWLGEIAEPNDRALDAFVARQTGLSSLRFVDFRAAPSIIEAMKAMAARAGVKWPNPTNHPLMIPANAGLTIQQLERHAVIEAIWGKLFDAGKVYSGGASAFLRSSMNLGINHLLWSNRELDDAIRLLGKKLRAKGPSRS
jgi:hypothetical protein